MQVDPITLEVINHRLREIGATMMHLLFHGGYSTILRESHDGSAGICDREGYAVLAAGSPIHLYPYYYSTRAVLQNYPLASMRDGDSFVLTDPYLGGNLHVPDLVVVTPIFVDGEVIGFSVSIAHKPDLGGLVPGSSGAGAREIFHEGLLLPGVRYWNRDGVVPDIEAIIRRNSRVPETVAGDIRAQVGCTMIGAQRVRDLCAEYGTETLTHAFVELQQLAEQRMRRELAAWPDGESEAEGWIDDDGVDLDRPIRLHVRIAKRGDAITIDYSGTNEQVKGPVNLRPQCSETAALLALVANLDPTIAMNDGTRRPITFINPAGRITNARWPAPVNSYYGITHVLYSTVGRALAAFNPGRAVATAGLGVGAIALGHRQTRGGKGTVQYELTVVGGGATPQHDGTSGNVGITNGTPNTPVEILETEFPIRVRRHEFIPDSAGAGRYRGGPGTRKEHEVLEDAVLTLRLGHQFKYPGWGVLGGGAPTPARAALAPGGASERMLRPLETLPLSAGAIFRIEMPGGGGYGAPEAREPEQVLDDVLNGYVSVEAAEREYRVAIDSSRLRVDAERTARLRSAMPAPGDARDGSEAAPQIPADSRD